MASPQPYYSTQNKGTLVPGQTISVNKYAVQVERYLSQGGFAHVYLVRTPAPVFGTTHHVLKRIAVPNEGMLTEVKKEVDIMRLLKGHPNIVYLIDAAWHKTLNGTYEVFILMEFCPGGGIIDMMNRRLRERLTEAEILQIFVDVCEGVACMHNLHPALLHRDLKVENILQSSPTSFKLCDFGSAITVSRPPTTTQEIRALEADLNRHTTLQYRAPEMIDVYQRKPVDEKSDVWALGVLLYKLCYYTTPFEEHGPLAILNVQYRIPSYPIYSPQMNELIGSMLQEHGTHRPTVFQLLDHVHRLRGTKSRFKYTSPVSEPLSPYRQTPPKPSKPPTHYSLTEKVAAAPKSIAMSVIPSKAKQTQRQVMDAIAPMIDGKDHNDSASETETLASSSAKYLEPQLPPMRRGRPAVTRSLSTSKASTSQNPPTSSAVAPTVASKDWLNKGFVAEEDATWKAFASADTTLASGSRNADVWKSDAKKPNDEGPSKGFGDDFSDKISVASSNKDGNAMSKPIVMMKRASPSPTTRARRPTPKRDAFEGLGLAVPPGKPAPTLGEARKLRTGLAMMNPNGFRLNADASTKKPSPLISPSPFKSPSPALPTFHQNASPSNAGLHVRQNSQYSAEKNLGTSSQTTESRFPSIEDLDASFSFKHLGSSSSDSNEMVQTLRRNGSVMRSSINVPLLLKTESRTDHSREATRLEQVTGAGMQGSAGASNCGASNSFRRRDENASVGGSSFLSESTELRPSVFRRDRHSFIAASESAAGFSSAPERTDTVALRSLPNVTQSKTMDWLTGDDEGMGSSSSSLPLSSTHEVPILRDSPSKQASVIVSKDMTSISGGVFAERGEVPPLDPLKPSKLIEAFSSGQGKGSGMTTGRPLPRLPDKPPEPESASSADEGPEDAGGARFGHIMPRAADTPRKGRKGRQSSVHDLVDLYGGGLAPKDRDRDRGGGNDKPIHEGFESQPTPQASKIYPAATPLNQNLLPPLRSPFSVSAGRSPTANGEAAQPKPSPSTSSRGLTPSPTTSARSRPQSMFMFPSKSSEGPSPVTSQASAVAGLPVPTEAMKHMRRTSISDMVQHFEGIGKPRAGVVAGKVPAVAVDLNVLLGNKEREEGKDRVVPTRVRLESLQTSMTPSLRNDIQTHVRTPTQDDGIPKLKSTYGQSKLSKTEVSPPSSSSPCSPPDGGSGGSSPSDRPYQGVGKLIEQWQRKTSEVDVGRGLPPLPKRPVPKRAVNVAK